MVERNRFRPSTPTSRSLFGGGSLIDAVIGGAVGGPAGAITTGLLGASGATSNILNPPSVDFPERTELEEQLLQLFIEAQEQQQQLLLGQIQTQQQIAPLLLGELGIEQIQTSPFLDRFTVNFADGQSNTFAASLIGTPGFNAESIVRPFANQFFGGDLDAARNAAAAFRARQDELIQQGLSRDDIAAILQEEASGLPGAVTTGFERRPPTEIELLQQDIQLGLLQQAQDALEGNLPVSPSLENFLTEGEAQLRERLLRQLGPGFETSSPGIEALGDFAQRGEELREASRRGQLADALGGGGQLAQLDLASIDQLISGASGITGQGFAGLQSVGGTDLLSLLSLLQGERQGPFQADIFNASQPTLLDQLLNTGILLGGSFLGGGGLGGIGRSAATPRVQPGSSGAPPPGTSRFPTIGASVFG